MTRSTVMFLALIIIGCRGDGSIEPREAAGAPAQAAPPEARLSLASARQLLRDHTVAQVGTIGLSGFNFSRELEIGKGIRVIVISRNLGGGLLVFAPDGINVGVQETGEVTWVQMFDVDEDGVAEIVAEEIEGRGTGVLEKAFRIYKISNQGVTLLWRGESSRVHAPTAAALDRTEAFIRFDASGAGQNARLTHLVEDSNGHHRESTYEWKDGALRLVQNPPLSRSASHRRDGQSQ